MKKIKENRGITLIALIITIIVLIILAVVAINAVQGDGIIAHAKNARDDYQLAQEQENETLDKHLSKLKDNEQIKDKSIKYYVCETGGIKVVCKLEDGLLEKKMYMITEENEVIINDNFLLNDSESNANITPNTNQNYILTNDIEINSGDINEFTIPKGTKVTSYFEGNTDWYDADIIEECFFEYGGKLYCFLVSGVAELTLDENFDGSILGKVIE